MQDTALYFLIAATIFCWRVFTARFLRESGRDATFRLSTMVADFVLDFIRAFWFLYKQRRWPPFGVWLHGLSCAAFFLGVFIVATNAKMP